MERETHSFRLIGGTEEEKAKVSKRLQEKFEKPDERFAGFELEKTPEIKEIIGWTEKAVDEVVRRYGGDPGAQVPLRNITVLKLDSFKEVLKDEHSRGFHKPIGEKIQLEMGNSKLGFANILAHELLHYKSMNSVAVEKSSDDDIMPFQTGLSVRVKKDDGSKKDLLYYLEEAVVAECTKEVMDTASGMPGPLKDEAEALQTLKKWRSEHLRRNGVPESKIRGLEREVAYVTNPRQILERATASSGDEAGRQAAAAEAIAGLSEKDDQIGMRERRSERVQLFGVVMDIVEKSGGKYRGEEVFAEFKKAHFSGDYRPLTRIVEGVLGSGSFKKLAEKFSK